MYGDKMINYPNGISKRQSTLKSHANRGMTLENEINATNEYYLNNDIAVVYKKPTPIQIVKQKEGRITDAFFKSPSTTDYNGLYKGYYIDFEVKETTSKTSFPIKNIHNHQINHIRNIYKHNGIVFLIVRFTKLNETYLLFGKDFINYIDNENKRSIPIDYFRKKGYIIKDKYNAKVDYIDILNSYGGLYGKKSK